MCSKNNASNALIVLSLLLLSCNKSDPVKDTSHNTQQQLPESTDLNLPTSPKNDVFIAVDEFSLGQSLNNVNLSNFEKYGNFYANRLKIYHIDNVKALRDNRYVTEVYLFFIDDKLSKIETLLTKDQSNKFLMQHGNCKLKPKDHFNVTYVKEQGALQKIRGRLQLNPNLTNYLLTWEEDDFNVYYRVMEPNYEQLNDISESFKNSKEWKYLYEPSYSYMVQSKNYHHQLLNLRNTYAYN